MKRNNVKPTNGSKNKINWKLQIGQIKLRADFSKLSEINKNKK